LGFGGEWAVGAALVAEIIPARQRGRSVGTVQSGWAVGWGAAAILYALLFSLLPAILAWRVLVLDRRAPGPPHPLHPAAACASRIVPPGQARPRIGAGAFLGIFAPGLSRGTTRHSLCCAQTP